MPSETGHAKNVANFKSLRTYVETLGAKYDPQKDILKVDQLKSIETAAENIIKELSAAKVKLSLAVDTQNAGFDLLDDHVIKVVNLHKALVDDQAQIEAVVNLKNLIKGSNKKASAVTPKTEGEVEAAEGAAPDERKDRKVVQRSFDRRLENFETMITLVGSNPQYLSSKENLTVAGLTQMHDTIKKQTEAVDLAEAAVINGRSRRNEILYGDNIGMVDVAKGVKNYVKAELGLGSPESDYLTAITFSNP